MSTPVVRLVAAVFACTLSASAGAADWSAFSSAFPLYPCQDGWSGCRVEGVGVISPEMQRDARGIPMPSDLRIGWFDLQPTATFSPHSGLSAYTASPATPGPTARSTPSPREVEPVAGERSVDVAPKLVPPPPPVEARRMAVPPVEVPHIDAVVSNPVIPTQAASLCPSPKALEGRAMLGKLDPAEVLCIEGKMADEAQLTALDAWSRVLIANDWMSGDRASWERRIRNHLDTISRADPNMCYQYASHLSRRSGQESEAIRWADAALENRHLWTKDNYRNRTFSLHKLKAKAAQELWAAAEQALTATPSPANRKRAEDTRNQTKVFAREWYEYAHNAGMDATLALQLCASAAGTVESCQL